MTALRSTSMTNRLEDLFRSLEGYDLLSTGVLEEINAIVPGGARGIAQLDENAVAGVLFEIVNKLRWRRMEPVLALHELPHPRYPVGEQSMSTDPPPVAMWDPPRALEPLRSGWKVLGFDVGFPIGIPSCELTCNADWIEFYARKGFHVLTYRTVRNVPTAGSPYDWVFLADVDHPWGAEDRPTEVRRADGTVPRDWRSASTATSFVAPCPESKIWEADMRDARRRLDRLGGQHLLIASVTDSVPVKLKSPQALAADFVEVATKAEGAGAQVIECYLARATARDRSGSLQSCERSAETSIAIVRAVRAALRPETRLLIKLSGDLSSERMEEIVEPLAKARLIDGVSGISPVRVERVTTGPDGETLWGDKPPGVAGYALREKSRAFIERLSEIRERHGLRFEIIAMGGVMTAEDVSTYLGLGASAVQMATAAVSDPGLAAEAFAHYRPSVQDSAEWDGLVLKVDADRGTFWARLVRVDAESPDEEAQFELTEVHPDDRREILDGTVFTWQTEVIVEGGKLVRRSSVRLKEVPALTAHDRREGRRLAARVAQGARSGPLGPIG